MTTPNAPRREPRYSLSAAMKGEPAVAAKPTTGLRYDVSAAMASRTPPEPGDNRYSIVDAMRRQAALDRE